MSELDVFGHSMKERILGFLYEARNDSVCFGDIVRAGEQFGINGSELEAFVREAIMALLEAGAVIVTSSYDLPIDWNPNPDYANLNTKEAAQKLLEVWKTAYDGYGFFACFVIK